MRAAIINHYGDASVFEITELPDPTCGPTEVLIKIEASSINPIDWKIRRGMLRAIIKLEFPAVLGFDIAGEVIAVGNKVSQFKVGDNVFALSDLKGGGAYAQLIALDQNKVVKMPANLNFYEAACIPLTGETALQALRDKAHLQPGQKVMVIGAAGGVGLFAIQLGKVFGAHVTAVCSGRHTELVRNLGAESVIDYTKDKIFVHDKHYDVIFDTVAKHSFSEVKPFLTEKGIYITTLPSLKTFIYAMITLFTKKKCKFILLKKKPQDLRSLAELAKDGKIKPIIDSIFPLEQIAAAHALSEKERSQGKIIINTQHFDTVDEASEESFPASDSPAWAIPSQKQ
jgi:2-desacetyl-2-hydroxyethyl bacteriochlorophyllide A dehydrogenase